ncbi:MAG: hypothetical protein IAF58_01445 [Leptolyngbya sp.]|nr:hypothetical protein [Candidatus Melainabacteria bacterium]
MSKTEIVQNRNIAGNVLTGLKRVFFPNFGLPNFKTKSKRISLDPDRLIRADDQDSEDYNFWGILFASIFVVVVCSLFFRQALPFGTWPIWYVKGNLTEWLVAAWPIFAWGAGFTTFVSVITLNDRSENSKAESLLFKGFLVSLMAGVVEELAFRWIVFYSSIATALALNFLFFGWAGFGAIQWVHNFAFGPLSNWLTGGHLAYWLVDPRVWFIGAGLLTANALFRDGHKYLGVIGYLNSWCIGMFMFYLLINYGLVACIVCHFAYDMLIFVVRYLDMFVERLFGRT